MSSVITCKDILNSPLYSKKRITCKEYFGSLELWSHLPAQDGLREDSENFRQALSPWWSNCSYGVNLSLWLPRCFCNVLFRGGEGKKKVVFKQEIYLKNLKKDVCFIPSDLYF